MNFLVNLKITFLAAVIFLSGCATEVGGVCYSKISFVERNVANIDKEIRFRNESVADYRLLVLSAAEGGFRAPIWVGDSIYIEHSCDNEPEMINLDRSYFVVINSYREEFDLHAEQ